MIARVMTPQILATFAGHWAVFLGSMIAVIAASCALGWLLSKLRLFPGTTAIWGLLPGAASVMMFMADEFGADGRLVAFMQYLRVVLVALVAAIIARVSLHAAAPIAPSAWLPDVHWTALGQTLVFIVLATILGKKSRIPAGTILAPLILGSVLKNTGILSIELPSWLLAMSYVLLGWNVGLRFTRQILGHAARTLPQTLLSVTLLMAFCWLLAWVLVKADGIDPLTAYLATSPGGLDSAAIIAASSKVDMSFVVSMQAARLFAVLLIGPALSRWIARRIVTKPPA
jgi:membrane AbrB-like protein